MIITSRKEYLKSYGNYKKYFKPKNDSELFEHRISDVTDEQMEIYIRKIVKKNKEDYENLSREADSLERKQLFNWLNPQHYKSKIESIPGLKDLMKTPYMLAIIIDIMPHLDAATEGKITRASIYKSFTRQNSEKEIARIMSQNYDIIPQGYDLELSFYNYSRDLAIRMWLMDKVSVQSESSNYVIDMEEILALGKKNLKKSKAISSEFNKFFAEDAKTFLARKGAQITFLDNRARFYHKSIMEYYSARFLYDALKGFKDRESNCMELLGMKLLYGNSKTDQESDVLNFLVQMIEDNDHQQNLLKEASSPEDKGVHLVEYLKEIVREQREEFIKPTCSSELKNILLISSHFPEVFESQALELNAPYFDDLLSNKALGEMTLSAMSKIAVELVYKIYIKIDSEPAENDQDLYKKFAKQRLDFDLGGKYDASNGNYKTTEKGLWVADTTDTHGWGLGTIEYDTDFGDQKEVYRGQWTNNQMEGKGTYQYVNHKEGYSEYDGEWVQGQHQGQGKLIYKHGLIFKGEFDQDMIHGIGVITVPQEHERWSEVLYYKGVWK